MSFYITETAEETVELLHNLPLNIGPDDEDEDEDDDFDFEDEDEDDDLLSSKDIEIEEIDSASFDDEDDDLYDDDL